MSLARLFTTLRGTLAPVSRTVPLKISSGCSIGANLKHGNNVKISSGCNVGDNVAIGDNVEISSGSHIGDNVTIGDNVKVGSGCHIQRGAIIGSNVKLSSACHVEKNCYVPDGTVAGSAAHFTTPAPEDVLVEVAQASGLTVTFNNQSCGSCGSALTFEEKPDGTLPKAVSCDYCGGTSTVEVGPGT